MYYLLFTLNVIIYLTSKPTACTTDILYKLHACNLCMHNVYVRYIIYLHCTLIYTYITYIYIYIYIYIYRNRI